MITTPMSGWWCNSGEEKMHFLLQLIKYYISLFILSFGRFIWYRDEKCFDIKFEKIGWWWFINQGSKTNPTYKNCPSADVMGIRNIKSTKYVSKLIPVKPSKMVAWLCGFFWGPCLKGAILQSNLQHNTGKHGRKAAKYDWMRGEGDCMNGYDRCSAQRKLKGGRKTTKWNPTKFKKKWGSRSTPRTSTMWGCWSWESPATSRAVFNTSPTGGVKPPVPHKTAGFIGSRVHHS